MMPLQRIVRLAKLAADVLAGTWYLTGGPDG